VLKHRWSRPVVARDPGLRSAASPLYPMKATVAIAVSRCREEVTRAVIGWRRTPSDPCSQTVGTRSGTVPGLPVCVIEDYQPGAELWPSRVPEAMASRSPGLTRRERR
jgi:hypothetical protein